VGEHKAVERVMVAMEVVRGVEGKVAEAREEADRVVALKEVGRQVDCSVAAGRQVVGGSEVVVKVAGEKVENVVEVDLVAGVRAGARLVVQTVVAKKEVVEMAEAMEVAVEPAASRAELWVALRAEAAKAGAVTASAERVEEAMELGVTVEVRRAETMAVEQTDRTCLRRLYDAQTVDRRR
jgi:hypothetical protein